MVKLYLSCNWAYGCSRESVLSVSKRNCQSAAYSKRKREKYNRVRFMTCSGKCWDENNYKLNWGNVRFRSRHPGKNNDIMELLYTPGRSFICTLRFKNKPQPSKIFPASTCSRSRTTNSENRAHRKRRKCCLHKREIERRSLQKTISQLLWNSYIPLTVVKYLNQNPALLIRGSLNITQNFRRHYLETSSLVPFIWTSSLVSFFMKNLSWNQYDSWNLANP